MTAIMTIDGVSTNNCKSSISNRDRNSGNIGKDSLTVFGTGAGPANSPSTGQPPDDDNTLRMANQLYHIIDSSNSNRSNNNNSNNNNDNNNENSSKKSNTHDHGVGEVVATCSVISSEASTEIHDNRTNLASRSMKTVVSGKHPVFPNQLHPNLNSNTNTPIKVRRSSSPQLPLSPPKLTRSTLVEQHQGMVVRTSPRHYSPPSTPPHCERRPLEVAERSISTVAVVADYDDDYNASNNSHNGSDVHDKHNIHKRNNVDHVDDSSNYIHSKTGNNSNKKESENSNSFNQKPKGSLHVNPPHTPTPAGNVDHTKCFDLSSSGSLGPRGTTLNIDEFNNVQCSPSTENVGTTHLDFDATMHRILVTKTTKSPRAFLDDSKTGGCSSLALLDVSTDDHSDDDDGNNNITSRTDQKKNLTTAYSCINTIPTKHKSNSHHRDEVNATHLNEGYKNDHGKHGQPSQVLPSVFTFNTTITESSLNIENVCDNDVIYEEEATPLQTAFGKELLFQRVLRQHNEDGCSDILSTASEMGTVVSIADLDSSGHGSYNYQSKRLNDLDNDLLLDTISDGDNRHIEELELGSSHNIHNRSSNNKIQSIKCHDGYNDDVKIIDKMDTSPSEKGYVELEYKIAEHRRLQIRRTSSDKLFHPINSEGAHGDTGFLNNVFDPQPSDDFFLSTSNVVSTESNNNNLKGVTTLLQSGQRGPHWSRKGDNNINNISSPVNKVVRKSSLVPSNNDVNKIDKGIDCSRTLSLPKLEGSDKVGEVIMDGEHLLQESHAKQSEHQQSPQDKDQQQFQQHPKSQKLVTSAQQNSYVPATTTSIISMAMRRIGSNFSTTQQHYAVNSTTNFDRNHNTRSNTGNNNMSASAPTTPRSRNHALSSTPVFLSPRFGGNSFSLYSPNRNLENLNSNTQHNAITRQTTSMHSVLRESMHEDQEEHNNINKSNVKQQDNTFMNQVEKSNATLTPQSSLWRSPRSPSHFPVANRTTLQSKTVSLENYHGKDSEDVSTKILENKSSASRLSASKSLHVRTNESNDTITNPNNINNNMNWNNNNNIPLRIARSCFSFDDTTIVEDPIDWTYYTPTTQNSKNATENNTDYQLDKCEGATKDAVTYASRYVPSSHMHYQSVSLKKPRKSNESLTPMLVRTSSVANNVSSPNESNASPILQSSSWDIGGSSQRLTTQRGHASNASLSKLSPFRVRSSSRRLPIRRTNNNDIFKSKLSTDQSSNNDTNLAKNSISLVHTPTRHASGRPIGIGNVVRGGDGGQVSKTTCDFSPIRMPNHQGETVDDAVQLMTPQRIEIEREDALDILLCLVERGISWTQEFNFGNTIVTATSNTQREDNEAKIDHKSESSDTSSQFTSHRGSGTVLRCQTPLMSDIFSVVRELEELSSQAGGEKAVGSEAHRRRKEALAELLKSYQYALEMKRASQSASCWLSSIGRRRPTQELGSTFMVSKNSCTSDWNHSQQLLNDARGSDKIPLGSIRRHKTEMEEDYRQAAGQESASEDIDLLTAKAMLHSAQMEANKKAALADRLNEELAKCRAEIGRLKTLSQKNTTLSIQMFRSPNRSILDVSDEISVTEADNEDEDDEKEVNLSIENEVNLSLENTSPIPPDGNDSGFLDTSFPDAGDDDDAFVVCKELSNTSCQVSKHDICSGNTNRANFHPYAAADETKLLHALKEANLVINTLQEQLRRCRCSVNVPSLTLDDGVLNSETLRVVTKENNPTISKTFAIGHAGAQSNTRTSISNQVLNECTESSFHNNDSFGDITANENNFTTDWCDLSSPLPNPPAHGLRSPLVHAVLEQWTNDPSLHKSLYDWMESVLVLENGRNDLKMIPPLTINSLDEQVRDGFILHILPILLRRPDIRVDVKTRAHRRTVYDIAVSVDSCILSSVDVASASVYRTMNNTHHVDGSPRRLQWEVPSPSPDVGGMCSTSSVTYSSATTTVTGNRKPVKAIVSSQNHRFPNNNTVSTPRNMTLGNNVIEKIGSSKMSYDEMAEDMTIGGSRMDYQHQQQSGLISALGGAIGGLLTRRAIRTPSSVSSLSTPVIHEGAAYTVASQSQKFVESPAPWTPPTSLSPMGVVMREYHDDATTVTTGVDHNQNDEYWRHAHFKETFLSKDDALFVLQKAPHDEEPYHRVVTAPSGRIGVTFVEFRGHCMVSDVAEDSPLLGYIYPSDILIAIDEVAVSGMRVRDIIKILKDRNKRSQRSLRVISGHAMNDVTTTCLPSSASNNSKVILPQHSSLMMSSTTVDTN